jgi:hypothetical protein
MVDPDDESIQMTKRAESIGLGARAELRDWYLGHLRPRMIEAVAARVVEPGAVEELDLQVAGLIESPGHYATVAPRLDLDPSRRRVAPGQV